MILSPSREEFWALLNVAQANNTPVVIQTLYTAKTITGSHAFAVLITSMDGDTKMYV